MVPNQPRFIVTTSAGPPVTTPQVGNLRNITDELNGATNLAPTKKTAAGKGA